MQALIKKITTKGFVVLLVSFILLSLLSGLPGETRAYQAQSEANYLVQGKEIELLEDLIPKYGGRVTSRLEIIHSVGAWLPSQAVQALLQESGVLAITPNRAVQISGKGDVIPETDYANVIGADVVWGEAVLGEEVTVAVVDTGIGWHRDLIKDLEGNLHDRIVGWQDFVGNCRKPCDPNGHGTHIAGIIANSQPGADGEWNGIAPGVRLVGARVLNDEGFGTYEQVIQGIQWVLAEKENLDIEVLNLSLVATARSPYWADPLNQAVMRAWAEGITVVVAAGNRGPDAMTIGVPGNNPYVITVGAFTDNYTPDDWSDDYLAPFSAAGPTLESKLAHDHKENLIGSHYFSIAGTSQAAGVVSGLAALILSENDGLTPDEVKHRIVVTALPWVEVETETALYSMWQQGAGRVNAPDAVLADISGQANAGMDIFADLSGVTHYEGYTYFDNALGVFRLRGPYESWAGGYGAWSGGYGAWSGGYGAWSGGYGAWSGGYGAWSGGYGAWSGGYGAWSGGYGAWSGGYGAWSGGYGAWSGGYGAWSGSEPWIGSILAEPEFVLDFLAGKGPDASSSITSISEWIPEP